MNNLNVMNTRKRTTLHDVAKLANVSIATVSAAFNDGPVRAETSARIFGAADKLGYRPNLIARSMKTRKSRLLGIILPWNNVEIIDAAVATAAAKGYDLISLFSGNDPVGGEHACMESLIKRMTDGVIFLPQQNSTEDYSQLLSMVRSESIKVVLIDRYFNEIKGDSVVTDNIQAGKLATEYLLKLGHKRILFFMDSHKVSSTYDRLEGYKSALQDAGIIFNKKMAVSVEMGGNAKEVAKDILLKRNDITAIFTTNDHLAYDVMLACNDIGKRIPDDISLVGFDDILLGPHRIGEILNPSLTTVRQNFSLMVQQAVELLIYKIEHNKPDTGKIRYIEPELITRKSVKNLYAGE